VQPPPADLASFAEDPFSYLPHLPSTAVFERDEYLLVSARDVRPDTASAQRIRLDGPAVEPAISFIRSWFGERGRDELTWWIGSSTTPDDFAERLQDAGARPFEDDPQLTAWCSRRHRRRRRRSRSGASSCVFADHGERF
jgi:hypothetical protein